MSKSRIFVLISVIVSLGGPQTRILLCKFKKENVNDSLIDKTTECLKEYFNNTKGLKIYLENYDDLIVVQSEPSKKCYTVVDAESLAKSESTEYALIGEINKDNNKKDNYRLHFELIKVNSDANPIYKESLETKKDPIEKTCMNLAKLVYNKI